jgi:hypothetical protein
MPASRSVGTPPLVLVGVKVEVNIAPEELESMDMDKIKAKYQEAQGAHPLTLGGAVVLHSRPDPVCIASHRIGMALHCVALRSIERRYQSYSVAHTLFGALLQRHCTPLAHRCKTHSSTRTAREATPSESTSGHSTATYRGVYPSGVGWAHRGPSAPVLPRSSLAMRCDAIRFDSATF